ncbi:hypothetical protein [[Phormidium] sp. ETS-05]|nr:hypothetical protein [[Phormidium] sp. ETS-05]
MSSSIFFIAELPSWYLAIPHQAEGNALPGGSRLKDSSGRLGQGQGT